MSAERDLALERGLPLALDAEKFVLAGILMGAGANVTALLKDTDFGIERHQRIYRAMLELESKGKAIDRATVAWELKRLNQLEADGVSYLASLDEGLPTLVNLDAYVSMVRDKSVLRQSIFVHQRAIDECLLAVDPTPDILERAERDIAQLSAGMVQPVNFRTPAQVVERAGGLSQIVNPDKRGCVQTPWDGLNRMLLHGGFTAGQMVVIGARPSMGKTAMACQIADWATSAGHGVPFFTLEMSDQSILLRMAAARAQVDSLKVTRRVASSQDISALMEAFNELVQVPNLWIDDTTGCTVPAMRAALRKLTAKNKIGLVVIDYLQLVEIAGRAGNRYEQISDISRGVKRIGREFGVPVVVLAQLNRESEKEARRPRLRDLRDSGSIEQDADVVLLPFLTNNGQDENGDVLAIELGIAKQRNGPTGIVPLLFLRRFAKFVEPDARERGVA